MPSPARRGTRTRALREGPPALTFSRDSESATGPQLVRRTLQQQAPVVPGSAASVRDASNRGVLARAEANAEASPITSSGLHLVSMKREPIQWLRLIPRSFQGLTVVALFCGSAYPAA